MLCAMEAHLNGRYFWIRTEADTTPSTKLAFFLRCDRATIVRSGWVKGQVVAGLAERSCFKLGMGADAILPGGNGECPAFCLATSRSGPSR